MIKLVECPACHAVAFDMDASQCAACGLLAGATNVLDEAGLDGFLYNARLRLQDLSPNGFQQIAAAMSPRPGRGAEDAIPFTEETCRMAHRYLVANGIRCIRIDVLADGEVSRSLAIANTQMGLDRCVRMARRMAMRARARLYIVTEVT